MQNVLDGLAGLDPARLSHGPDVEVRHVVDHDEVMATASLLLMGAATVAVGLLPTYEQIGVSRRSCLW